MKKWNKLTQGEALDYEPILLTAEQYIDQLRIGSSEWFDTRETKRFCLVGNSIKWTLIYKTDDCSWVKLQRREETVKVFAQKFIEQYSFDFAV